MKSFPYEENLWFLMNMVYTPEHAEMLMKLGLMNDDIYDNV